jgi:hypothetical protein
MMSRAWTGSAVRRLAGKAGSFVVAVAAIMGSPASAHAQKHCAVICAPSLSVIPTANTNHLFGRPTVRSLASGAEQRLPSTTNLEIIVVASVHTALPRTSLFGSAQWLPTATESRNPFTLYAARDVGEPDVRANAPTLSGGASIDLLQPAETHGWLALDANIGDLYSSAARPGDASAYTHKLDLGLVAQWSLFEMVPAHTYLHGVTLFTLLDYVATGLPHAGDEVPKGTRVFVDDVHSASLIAGLSLPLTPR